MLYLDHWTEGTESDEAADAVVTVREQDWLTPQMSVTSVFRHQNVDPERSAIIFR